MRIGGSNLHHVWADDVPSRTSNLCWIIRSLRCGDNIGGKKTGIAVEHLDAVATTVHSVAQKRGGLRYRGGAGQPYRDPGSAPVCSAANQDITRPRQGITNIESVGLAVHHRRLKEHIAYRAARGIGVQLGLIERWLQGDRIGCADRDRACSLAIRHPHAEIVGTPQPASRRKKVSKTNASDEMHIDDLHLVYAVGGQRAGTRCGMVVANCEIGNPLKIVTVVAGGRLLNNKSVVIAK